MVLEMNADRIPKGTSPTQGGETSPLPTAAEMGKVMALEGEIARDIESINKMLQT